MTNLLYFISDEIITLGYNNLATKWDKVRYINSVHVSLFVFHFMTQLCLCSTRVRSMFVYVCEYSMHVRALTHLHGVW